MIVASMFCLQHTKTTEALWSNNTKKLNLVDLRQIFPKNKFNCYIFSLIHFYKLIRYLRKMILVQRSLNKYWIYDKQIISRLHNLNIKKNIETRTPVMKHWKNFWVLHYLIMFIIWYIDGCLVWFTFD